MGYTAGETIYFEATYVDSIGNAAYFDGGVAPTAYLKKNGAITAVSASASAIASVTGGWAASLTIPSTYLNGVDIVAAVFQYPLGGNTYEDVIIQPSRLDPLGTNDYCHAIAGAYLLVTLQSGSASPLFVDSYHYCGNYPVSGGYPAYESDTLGTPQYVWWDGSNYVITPVLGTLGSNYFLAPSSVVEGVYVPQGTNTGAPSVAYQGTGTANQLMASNPVWATVQSGVAQANIVKIGSQTATASGGVTFPTGTLASTTNITALGLASIGFPQLSNDLATFISRSYLVVTGTNSPSLNDTYHISANHNNLPVYTGNSSGYSFWSNGSGWTCSAVVGTNGANYWTTTGNVNGTYTAAGSATGAPVVVAHGNATMSTFQPDYDPLAIDNAIKAKTDNLPASPASSQNVAALALPIISDAVQASPAPSTTIFAGSNSLNATDSAYVNMAILFTSGANIGFPRKLTAYVGSTRTFTLDKALPVAPSAGDTFDLIGYSA